MINKSYVSLASTITSKRTLIKNSADENDLDSIDENKLSGFPNCNN